LRRLDRVFYRGDIHATGAFAGHTEVARRASDHLPLIVDFDLAPSSTNIEANGQH
jgi:endonuclease/exonuclease/phosphatase family metal-dependent hydrolase